MQIQLNIVAMVILVPVITSARESRNFDIKKVGHGKDVRRSRYMGHDPSGCPACPLGYVCCVTGSTWSYYMCCPTTTTTTIPLQPSGNSWTRSEVTFEKNAVVTCGRKRYSVLSCGIGNSRYVSREYRLAYPTNQTACECRSTEQARCVAWCALFVDQWQLTLGRCHGDSRVVSCHPGNSNVRELNFYPNHDGSV